MNGKFKVGDFVQFGNESWQVKKYHKVSGRWEIAFENAAGNQRSVMCSQLERLV